MEDYNDAYNAFVTGSAVLAAGELGASTGGYKGAYTELNANGSGACVEPANIGSQTLTAPMEATAVPAHTWYDGATDAQIGVASTATEALSVCAKACSALGHWGVDPTSNLPYTYALSTGVLTSTDADAVTNSLTTMDNTYCTGFDADISGLANGLVCKGYYGAFPTAAASGDAASECYTRNRSVTANTYSEAVVATTAGAGTSDWDYFDAAMTVWATAYEDLIDARAELDIAVYYYDQLNPIYTNTA